MYEYQKYIDTRGVELWVGKVDLPHVGLPLLANSRRIGPIVTGACYSLQQAHIEAAINALRAIQVLIKYNIIYSLIKKIEFILKNALQVPTYSGRWGLTSGKRKYI